jgi:hypothetical protein
MIIGNEAQVREEMKRWEAAGVTMLLLTAQDGEQIRKLSALADG